MEYTFVKNNSKCSFRLEEYFLKFSCNGENSIIRYAQINAIRLKRSRQKGDNYIFSCTIYVTDGPNLHVESYSQKDDKVENHFNHYNQFIRVLHLHLMSKSQAKFRYGMSYNLFSIHFFIAAFFIVSAYPLASIFGEYMLIIYFLISLIVAFCLYKIIADKPGSYKPEIIPYHILPGTSNA